MEKEYIKVLSNHKIAKDTYEMRLYAPKITKTAYQGQFINIGLKSESKLLKRPISINSIDGEYLTICYKINGFGTKEMASYPEETVLEAIGPLGHGFPLVNKQRVFVVGGGIGVAPIVELVKNLKDNDLTILLSFRDSDSVIYEDKLKEYGKVIVTTDDGSYGYMGNAMDYLNEFNPLFDTIYGCGPEILLKLLEKKYEGKNGYLSYEARMACGLGLCHGCIKGSDHYCVCTDGPVFRLGVIK